MNNPLAQSRHRTMAVQAPVVGKVFPDLFEIEQREYQSKDNAHTGKVVPGGDKNVNFSCMPGEICLSRVYNGGSGFMDSRYEVGLTSSAGLYQDKSSEAVHREHRFVGGVGENGYEHGGDGMYGTDPLEHGYAVIRSGGPFTTHNWTHEPIYAGQILEFKIPLPTPEVGADGSRKPVIDTGNNSLITLSIRSGTPLQKPVYYLQPCDPSSFETSLAGIHWCMKKTRADGGIGLMDEDPNADRQELYKDYFNNPDKFTNLQLEAIELKTALTTLHALARATPDITTFMKEVFGRHVASDVDNKPYSADIKRDVKKTWNECTTGPQVGLFLQDKILPMLAKSFTGQLRAKMSRVVGVALSNARPGETLDVLIRPSY